jgi:DNA invertase Pin-like site-specific DNA recombinase
MSATKTIRCGIYTRKSSEEGLDQNFNSLHAQREACAAYIQSQRHEGWRLLPTHYDDGGYSGGTLERPALQQLLADVRSGAVDLIVVYKIDRLTRSLNDFAKIVELLDTQSASFVSVTQSFNTTTSMGRLTLNVLLSFAQFEREVTGERIRDKIGASKKKGMWMGGFEPLGYSAAGRQLVVHSEEAALVRRIFDLYRTHKNVSVVARTLSADGVVSKQRPDTRGRGRGGVTYSSGALFNILRNPIYCGKIRHKDAVYPGQHDAIISEADWDEAQAIRQSRSAKRVERKQNRNPLLGLLVDDEGRRYRPTHTTKGHRKYRYYVSVTRGATNDKRPTTPTARLPAEDLETYVADRIRAFLRSPTDLLNALSQPTDPSRTRKQLVDRAVALADQFDLTACTRFVRAIRVKPALIEVVLLLPALREALAKDDVIEQGALERLETVTLMVPVRLYKTGHDLRLVIEDATGVATCVKRDDALVRRVARGRRWYEELTSGRIASIAAIAKREKVHKSHVTRLLYGALLAPDIVERILEGSQPANLTATELNKLPPLDWNEQRHRFGLPIAGR